MRKSSVTSKSSFPCGASSCQTASTGLAFLAQILAHDAVRRAEQVLQEVFVPLAGRAENIRTPYEHVARPVLRPVGILAGELQVAAFELLRDVVLCLHAGGG